MEEHELKEAFTRVLRLFPELSQFKIRLGFFASRPGFPQGKTVRDGSEYTVYLAPDLIKDPVEAEFVIAHELAHILVNPERIPSKKEKAPEDPIELLDMALEDVICDWIALKRLEQAYANENEKLAKLYTRYLESVGPKGNVSIAEEMKERTIIILRERYREELQRVLEKHFLGLDPNNLAEFTVLAIAKYLRIS